MRAKQIIRRLSALCACQAIAAAAIFAQTAPPPPLSLSLIAPATAQGNGATPATVTLTIQVTGTANQNLSALEWQLALPSGATVIPNASTPSAMVMAIAKNVGFGADVGGCPPTYQGVGNCGMTVGTVVGMVDGALSNQPFAADGVIATVPISIPANTPAGNLSFSLLNTLGVDTSGNPLTVAPGATGTTPVTVKYTVVANPCDTNSDGAVNYTDALAVLGAVINPLSAKCPLVGYACNLANLQAVIMAGMGGACALK